MRQMYGGKDAGLTPGDLMSAYVRRRTPRSGSVVTTNREKSAEAIVGGNAEGLNKTRLTSFIVVVGNLITSRVEPKGS